jgi:imidazole glycerol-phosphate synthase subunit HisH
LIAQSIVVVDYGAGNLRSVVNALHHLGYQAEVSDRPEVVRNAGVIILPGVGAAGAAMRELAGRGLVEPLCQHIFHEKPLLGVCLGLQLLFAFTEEGGLNRCLGVVPGMVKKFPGTVKIPHMGWNQVRQTGSHPLFEGIPDNSNFYFVHSYYGAPEDASVVAGETDYGLSFASVIARGNLAATQFHPEKSGEMGLKIYQNFLNRALKG